MKKETNQLLSLAKQNIYKSFYLRFNNW